MKKITFVIFAFLLSFMGFAQFGPEGFEGAWTPGSGPAGWSIINAAGPARSWAQVTSNVNLPAHTGNSAAYMQNENVADGTFTDDWLITPAITMPSAGQLNFWSRLYVNGDQGTIYKVFIGTDPANMASFTELASWTELEINPVQTEYTLKRVNIPSSYAGQSVHLAFVMRGDNGDRWLVDDVSVVTLCSTPTAVTVPNITGTGATVAWTDASNAGTYQLQVVPTGQAPTETGGQTVTNATTAVVTSLLSTTTYDVYVRSKCQPDGNNSEWAGPITFTTLQVPATLNWNTDFESSDFGFTLVNGNQANKWYVGTAVSTSPTHSLYISGNNGVSNGYDNMTASVVHAYRDVIIPPGAAVMALSFDWRCQGEANNDRLRVWNTPVTYTPVAGTQTTAVSGNVNVPGVDLSLNGTWTTNQRYFINVSAYAGTTRRFIFEWANNNNNGTSPPAAVDNVDFTLVTCPQPTNLAVANVVAASATNATADVTWTEASAATQWEVFVAPVTDPAPTAASTGTIVNSTSYTIPTLNLGVKYRVYVRAVCGPTDKSFWTGPVEFTTPVCLPSATCNYNFVLTDSGNNGWQNNTMSVRQNGIEVATLTLTSQGLIPVTRVVPLCNGIPFELYWNIGGNNPEQVGVTVVNNFNQVLFTKPAGTGAQDSSLFTGNVDCNNPACLSPTGLTASGIGLTDATLTWTALPTISYEYYIVPFTEAAPTDATVGIPVTGNSVTRNDLSPSTTYNYYVRAICNSGASTSPWSAPYNFATLQSPATVTYDDNFEGPFTWTMVNGSQPNKWFYGTAVSNSATHSLYITNDNGVSNAYTNSTASVVHVYRDVLIPAGTTIMAISFDWRNVGEASNDRLRVFNIPVTVNPVAGTSISTASADNVQITPTAGLLNSANWTSTRYLVDVSAYAGTVRRFDFEWRNNANSVGVNPPAAIDNIQFKRVTCTQPTAVAAANPTTNSADITWTEAALATQWEVYVVPVTEPAPTEATVGTLVTGTAAYTPTTLSPGVVYNVYVRAVCSDSDKSFWTGPASFTTLQVPASLTYTEDFEGPLTWTLTNGSQANKWFYGTAVSNSATHSLYITNDNGASNAYTTTATSTVHAYRDISIPAGTTQISVTYDWRNDGETNNDRVRLLSTPLTYTPVAGTQVPVSTNNINHSGNLSGRGTWTNRAEVIDVTAYAGTTRRFIFEWVNNGSLGSNPPAAIDNLEFKVITCVQPTNLAVGTIEDISANITWVEAGTATQWEVFVLPEASPAPTATSVGVIVNGTPSYTAPGLTPGTSYKVYVRAICGPGNNSLITGPVTFKTGVCPLANQCSYTFTLTDSGSDGWGASTMSVRQNGTIVATLSLPNGAGPLAVQVPLCANAPFDVFWNAGGTFLTEVGLTVKNIVGEVIFTKPSNATDNSIVYSDITNCVAPNCVRPEGIVTNCLSSEGVNLTWTDPGNISQWQVVVQPTTTPAPTTGTTVTVPNYTFESPLAAGVSYTAWVRAVCADGVSFSNWNQVTIAGPQVSVGDSRALCAGVLAVPQASNYGGTVPPYGTVGCLSTTPNPTWYYVRLNEGGTVSLDLSQRTPGGTPIDVDFAIFGPFDSKLDACAKLGSPRPNTAYMVDCSYSASAFETIDFTGAAGKVFALLVTNFNGQQGNVTINQTSGPSLSCDPVVELGTDKYLCNATSYNLTARVDNPGVTQVYTYTWLQDGQPYTPTVVGTTASSQTISITDTGSHVYTVTVTMPVPSSATPVTDTVTIAISNPYTAPTYNVITACSTGTTGDANVNINFLGTLDPTKYSFVGLYASIADANNNINAIDVTQPYSTTDTTLYAVITDTAMPDCKTLVPLQIDVTLTSATLGYAAAYCPTDPASPSNLVQTGGTAGTYTVTPEVGLTLDPLTGEITPATSTPGSYHITYTIPATATCPAVIAQDDIQIINITPTTISYGGPFCRVAGTTAPVNIMGASGGTFSSTDTNLVIDANGTVDLGLTPAGIYPVSYVLPGTGSCPAPIVPNATIEIIEPLTGTLSYAGTPYCSNAGTAMPSLIPATLTGGSYVANSPGLSINPATGEIDLAASVAGVYIVNYVVPASGPCGEFRTADTTVTIVAAPDPATTIAYSAPAYCSDAGTIAAPQITGTTGGTFRATPAGLDIDPATGAINTLTSTAGVAYTITYAVPATAPCLGFDAPSVTVTITPLPVAAITYGGTTFCSNGGSILPTLSGSHSAGGTYTASNGLIINPVSGEIDLGVNAAGKYDVIYTVPASAGCAAVVSAPVNIIITKLPIAEFTYPVIQKCNAPGTATIEPVMATDAVKGTFTVDRAGLAINPTSGVIDPSASDAGEYKITNTVIGTDGCAGQIVTSTVITVTITNAPVADFSYSAAAYCKATTTTVPPALAGVAGQFTSTPAGLSINAATGVIDVANSQPGAYTIINTIAATSDCLEIVSTPVNVIITAQPVITTTQGCVDNKYQLQVVLDSDPIYSVDNVDIVWTYTNSTGATENVGTTETVVVTKSGNYVVTVNPKSGAACAATLPVNVVTTMCNVQRGISPDGSDGLNDNFVLTGLDVRKLVIFNRYGKEVYKFEGQYTDQWHGQTSSNEDLPTGTYFYTFVRSNGENRTGWIYVNRGVK